MFRPSIPISEDNTQLFALPGFPEGFPENILVLDHAKEYFKRGQLSMGDNYGQGMVGLAWRGIGENDNPILAIDLFITFNFGDGKEKKDKDGKPYESHEFIQTKTAIGHNTGTAHESAMEFLQARIKEDIKNNRDLTIYDSIYKIENENIILDKNKIFGFGVLKGDNSKLLFDFRNKSANLNNHSVKYNREFLLCNYFDETLIREFDKIYYIERSLPTEVADKIKSALLNELPLEQPDTERQSRNILKLDNYQYEKNWKKIAYDPEEKNDRLLNTLAQLTLKKNDEELAKEIIFYMEKNASLLKKDLKTYLDTPIILSTGDGKTALMNAIEQGYHSIALLLINNQASLNAYTTKGNTFLTLAVMKEDSKLVKKIIDYMKFHLNYTPEQIIETLNFPDKQGATAIQIATKKNLVDIITLLKNEGVIPPYTDRKLSVSGQCMAPDSPINTSKLPINRTLSSSNSSSEDQQNPQQDQEDRQNPRQGG